MGEKGNGGTDTAESLASTETIKSVKGGGATGPGTPDPPGPQNQAVSTSRSNIKNN